MKTLSKVCRPIILSVLVLSVLSVGNSARALEGLKVFRGVLVLEGIIEVGDYDKVRTFLGEKFNFDKINNGVFLASPGGNVIEAIKIGRLIRSLRLSTDAPSGPPNGAPRFGQSLIAANDLVKPQNDNACASACFFIYVAGVYRNLGWAGRLGVHRPVLLESNAKELNVEQTVDVTWQVRGRIQKYLEEMNVPGKYVDLMYSVPPNEVRWISQREFDTDIAGFVPDVKTTLRTKCNLQMKASVAELKKCWGEMRAETLNEAWNKVFKK